MEKLTFLGIGPKIGRIALPYLAVTIFATIFFPQIFTFGKDLREPLQVAGIVVIVFALILYFMTLRLMVPGIRGNRLITGGIYRFSRNPLYLVLLFLVIPGVSLIMNSWIIFSVSIVGYLVLKKHIREEELLLERIFGAEYRAYRDKTPLLFPTPFKQ